MLKSIASIVFVSMSLLAAMRTNAQEQPAETPSHEWELIPTHLTDDPAVRRELQLTPEQLKSLKAIEKEFKAELTEAIKVDSPMPPNLDVLSDDEKRAQWMKEATERTERLTQRVLKKYAERFREVLDEKQQERLQQIQWQQWGITSLRDPLLARALELSDDQRKRIDAIWEESEEKSNRLIYSNAAQQSASDEETERVRAELEQVYRDRDAQLQAVLTPEQASRLEEVKGAKIELAGPQAAEDVEEPDVKEPDSVVTVGENLFVRTPLKIPRSIGLVTDIENDPSPETALGIAGLNGAVLLDGKDQVTSEIKFTHASRGGLLGFFGAPMIPSVIEFIDAGGDGFAGFLNRGGGGWGDASLLDQQGKTVWTYGGTPGLNSMAAGDFEGDGEIDFVAGFNGGGGLRRLTHDRKLKWRQPGGNIWHVEIVDVDEDGTPEIVHTSASGRFTIRNAAGKQLAELGTETYTSDFTLCRWPKKDSPQRLLVAEEDQLWLIDFEGATVAQLTAKGVPEVGGTARGVPVRLKKGALEVFAVLVESDPVDSSRLLIFEDKALIYEEVFEDRRVAIATVPAEDGTDALLIGGTGVVWHYMAK